jgi:hypothetical protein
MTYFVNVWFFLYVSTDFFLNEMPIKPIMV